MIEVNRKPKVIIGMSGGVDSSVAAALLKEAGFDVIGLFMKFWSERKASVNKCCNARAEIIARKVALKIGIKFFVINAKNEFKKAVVNYFLKEYESGRTPNPCVVCNREIKFKILLNKALEVKADFVATGHYAKIKKTKNKNNKNNYHLLKSENLEKDQSYFLWKLNQNQLKHILFPVGDYSKDEVRKLANEFKLPEVSSAKESQEVCFIATKLEDFLRKHIVIKSGKIVDIKEKIIGQHNGLAFYTIGQRKGIKLAGGPYYVVDKDVKKNFLIVSKNIRDLNKKELIFEKANWVSGKKPKLPLKVRAQIRYRHKSTPSTIFETKNGKYKLIFDKPESAITSGQSVVFYSKNEILGGGIIS